MASIKITLFALLFLTIFTYSKAELGDLKETHITLYYKDYPYGLNATTIELPAPSNKPINFTRFGHMSATDDPLTEEIEEGSPPIARGRGFYVVNNQDGSSGQWIISVVFIKGKHKGSTLELHGDYSFYRPSELVVTGGTGKFRLARGYALFESLQLDPKTGYTLLRSNMTVLHY